MSKRGDTTVMQFLILIVITVLALTIFGVFVAKMYRAWWGEKADPQVQDMQRILAQVTSLTEATSGRSSTDLGFAAGTRMILQSARSPVTVGRCARGQNCLCVLYAAGKEGSVYCEALPPVKAEWFGTKSGFTAKSEGDCPSSCGGNIVCLPDSGWDAEFKLNEQVRITRRCNDLVLEKVGGVTA